MLMGGHGVISVTANVAPALMARDVRGRAGRRPRHGARAQRPPAAAASQALRRAEPDPGEVGARRDGPHRERLRLPLVAAVAAASRRRPRRAARGRLSRCTEGASHAAASFAVLVPRRPSARRCVAARSPAARGDARSARRSTTSRSPRRRRWRCRRTSRAAVRRPLHVATASGARRARRARARAAGGDDRAQRQRRRARSCAPAPSAGWWCKATPEQVWNVAREFWPEQGFVARHRAAGVRASWKPTGRRTAPSMPHDFMRESLGKVLDVFYTTYKRDKFRTRLERGAEPGTVEIYISHRGMEQVPTARSTRCRPPASPGR